CRLPALCWRLLSRYNQPFEDAPLVQMSTLTYETPQGLRIWGGGLVKEKNKGQIQCTGDGGGEDARVTLSPPLASPAGPAPGRRGRVSGESPGGPVKPASRPCSADLAVVPRSASVSLQGTGGHGFSSSLSFEPDDICDVTISDLYAGMLHSMSLLLSTKPSCILSTKTSFVLHNWSSRRRCSRSRVNGTHCRGGRRPHRGSRERLPVRAGPGRDRGALRDCENVLDASGQKTGLKLDKAFLEVNKPQALKWGPSWKESLTPEGRSLLPYGDSRAVCHLHQKNRYKALKWFISPVKIVSTPRILPGKRGSHYREIESRFDKLHQEYCPSPRKQPVLTSLPGSSAVDVYRGGPASPRGPRGFETRRLSGTFGTAEAKRLNEALEELGDRARGAGRCLQRRGSPPPLPETSPVQSPRRSEQTLLFWGNDSLGILRKSASPNRPTSVAGVQPLSCGRDRYKEIKEKFDKLHQKYCQQSPPRTKALLRVGACPDKASLEVQHQRGTLGTLNPDSGFQSPPKLSASPQQSIEHPLRLTATEAQPLTRLVLTAARGHRSPPKRRRLSDSVLCGQWASSQDSSRVVGQPIPRPGERSSPHSPAEKKRCNNTSFKMEEKSDFVLEKFKAGEV
uniref:Holliday junction recognition protein n=1 Tax=Panthera tigris altaica TaxID=74533 RepID=A0A8C9KHD9_PANTA